MEEVILKSELHNEFIESNNFFFYCKAKKGNKIVPLYKYNKYFFPDEVALKEINHEEVIIVSPICINKDMKIFEQNSNVVDLTIEDKSDIIDYDSDDFDENPTDEDIIMNNNNNNNNNSNNNNINVNDDYDEDTVFNADVDNL